MDTLSYKTISANKATVNKEWVLVDAEGQSLGRLASHLLYDVAMALLRRFVRHSIYADAFPHGVGGNSINTENEAVEMITKGRHDPCVGIRAIPIAEAMMAITLMDHLLRHHSARDARGLLTR